MNRVLLQHLLMGNYVHLLDNTDAEDTRKVQAFRLGFSVGTGYMQLQQVPSPLTSKDFEDLILYLWEQLLGVENREALGAYTVDTVSSDAESTVLVPTFTLIYENASLASCLSSITKTSDPLVEFHASFLEGYLAGAFDSLACLCDIQCVHTGDARLIIRVIVTRR